MKTTIALNNLAAQYHASGDAARPERFCLRALQIKERILGPEHPEIVLTPNNLAVFSRL